MLKQKVELNPAAVKMYIDLHIKIGLPFEIVLTNYTTHLKSAKYDIRFMKNAQSNRVFLAYQKIKADAVKKPVKEINAGILKYYQTNFNFSDIYADKIYNVDLKSAYATILHNDGYISKETFEYISKLPKMERLTCVGMLAGRKNYFQFDAAGDVVSSSETISPTSNYFFHAVARTYEIIDSCRVILENDFLFSWVDGIYFKNGDNGEKLRAMLTAEYNLNSSFDELTEFEIQSKKGYYLLTYLKDDEMKTFNIPMQSNRAKQTLYNYLLTKTYKNEVRTIEI
jgi:hypothetical protein